jgi:hypothetical protein
MQRRPPSRPPTVAAHPCPAPLSPGPLQCGGRRHPDLLRRRRARPQPPGRSADALAFQRLSRQRIDVYRAPAGRWTRGCPSMIVPIRLHLERSRFTRAQRRDQLLCWSAGRWRFAPAGGQTSWSATIAFAALAPVVREPKEGEGARPIGPRRLLFLSWRLEAHQPGLVRVKCGLRRGLRTAQGRQQRSVPGEPPLRAGSDAAGVVRQPGGGGQPAVDAGRDLPPPGRAPPGWPRAGHAIDLHVAQWEQGGAAAQRRARAAGGRAAAARA